MGARRHSKTSANVGTRMPGIADESMMRMAERPDAGDELLLVRFERFDEKQVDASEKAGQPIYMSKEYVRIRPMGSKDEVHREVRPSDLKRFPRHYQAFKLNQEMPLEGMPLAEWPIVGRGEIEMLNAIGIRTVEELAIAPDGAVERVRNGFAFKRKAKTYLDAAKDGAHAQKLAAALAARDSEIELLKVQMQQLAQRLAKSEAEEEEAAAAPPRRGPGRPRKVQAESSA